MGESRNVTGGEKRLKRGSLEVMVEESDRYLLDDRKCSTVFRVGSEMPGADQRQKVLGFGGVQEQLAAHARRVDRIGTSLGDEQRRG